jgi:hypothetical protein
MLPPSLFPFCTFSNTQTTPCLARAPARRNSECEREYYNIKCPSTSLREEDGGS